MTREIKLGIGVAVLCLVLFLLLLGIGNANKKPNPSTEDEVVHTDTEGSEVEKETENDSSEVISTEENNDTTELESESESESQDDEYINFAIADVSSYVNVRKEPNTDSAILGKIYDGAVAQILATVGEGENQWFQIVSGNVEGYIKAEYFIHGEEAAAIIDQYVAKYVLVNVNKLNVRKDKTTSSSRIGYVCAGERLKLLEDCGEWIRVQYADDTKGYVFAKHVAIQEEYIYAKTAEDEKAEKAFVKELKKRAGVSEETVKENPTISVKPPSPTYTTNTELRKAIIDYAMQFLGNRYVNGGQSLTSGTDCSGFTMYVLREFGISVGRTPQSQYKSAGRKISYSQAQPGDIICYSSNGGKSCTHVAFYIGNGKILHASNPRDGVKISPATYDDIYAVRNVID